jgi:ribosomal-protein-alanine N-acetyltransferase
MKILKPLQLARELPTLSTKRLILRKMALNDAGDMFEYASDPEVTKFTLWEHHGSKNDSVEFLKFVTNNYEKGEIENWGITLKETGRFIGTCGYFNWKPQHFSAEIQYTISKAYWSKGFMTEAVEEVIRFGFEEMMLNRIQAKCMVDNIGSERVMQKAEMKFEGIMRQGVFAKGKYHDLKVYSILKNEWNGRK